VPLPKNADLRRFCAIDGWEEVTRVRGGTGDHVRMRKILRDGTILRTRISHGAGEIADPNLWRHVWREQLGLSDESEFWRVLRTKESARRGDEASVRPTGPSVPAWVVTGLLREGVSEAEIRALSAAEAESRLRVLWSTPPAEERD
jgi:hypothetical protein